MRPNLEGAFLFRAQLAGADLSEACLQGADLSRVDLTSASLAGIMLRDTNLHLIGFGPEHKPVHDGSDSVRLVSRDRFLNWGVLRRVGNLPLFEVSTERSPYRS